MEDSGIDSGDPKPTFKNEAKVFVTVGLVPKPNKLNNKFCLLLLSVYMCKIKSQYF